MGFYRATITYIGPKPGELAKEHRAAVKTGMQEIVKEWWAKTLPDHFTARGATKYKYKKRSQATRARKRRMHRRNTPLVESGVTRRMATSTARISGTSKSAKATMNVPWYITAGRVSIKSDVIGTTPENRVEEILTTTKAEAFKQARRLDRLLQRHFDKQRQVTKERV